MKAILTGMLVCFALFSTSLTFACGGDGCQSANRFDECGNGASSCGGNESYYGTDNQASGDCQCADNGWRYNDCISKCEYCYAYGNIGAR